MGADHDVNEANLTHNNIGGTLGVTKGGTGATTQVGAQAALGFGTIATQSAGVLPSAKTKISLGPAIMSMPTEPNTRFLALAT